MRYLNWLMYFMLIPAVIAAPGAHGPDGQHLSEKSPNKTGTLGRQADGSVIMPMPDQALLGIRTQLVSPATARVSISLSAVVRPHPQGHAVVQPSSDGRVEAIDSGIPVSGQQVRAGQLLGYVRYQDSAYEQASQTSELLAVRNQIAQLRRDTARLESLGELASEQDKEQLQTRLKSLKEQEQALQQGLEKPEPLLAPIEGVLVNHQVRNGQWVEAGSTLFEIVAPDLRQIDAVTQNMQILTQLQSATLASHPDIKLLYQGHSPRLSAGMATLHFAYRRSQPTEAPLLLDQPVTLIAPLQEQAEGLILPAASVVSNAANLPIVWIKVSAERFLPQLVRYQDVDADRVLITQGLGADNRVVVEGTSLLNQVR